MKKRARICFYIFIACAFFALGILGYFVFNQSNDNVMVGSKKFVTFNEVPNASVYTMSVKNGSDNTEYVAYYKITKSSTDSDKEYLINTEVSIEDKKVAEESYKQKIISERNEKIDCEIKEYKVTFFDELGVETETIEFEDQTLKNVSKNTLCCVISEYFDSVFIKDGIYKVECSAIDEDGNVIENSSIQFDYNYEAYYLREFARRPSFFMNGQDVDYVIDSKAEFKEFVWHTILYREDDITFYSNTNDVNEGNVNSLTVQAINDYPEYDGLYDSGVYATINNNVGKLYNFNYYLDFNFTKSYKNLEDKDANAYNTALQQLHSKNTNFNIGYIKKTGEVGERIFPIDSAEKEVLVYNTEQLFMVAQYGAKPVFLNEDDEGYSEEYEVAKTVYNNAREELKTINNSNELSDYVKALNIYRYLCQNVVYDYVTYQYMNIKNDFSVYTFGSYNCFYLEGVFLDLDNQYAVCDGLAKAYTLLCRIEGIPCVKVNGTVSGENHAWNKVGLEDDDEEVKWMYVDTTWGVGTNNNEKQEYLTHSYFLFKHKDRLNNEVRQITFASEIDVSNGNGDNKNPIEITEDYYKRISYSFNDDLNVKHEGNCYIESNAELQDVLDFVKYKLNQKKENEEQVSQVLEIEMSSLYVNFGMFSEAYTWQNDAEAWLTSHGFDENIKVEWFNVTKAKDIVLFRFYEEVEEQEIA